MKIEFLNSSRKANMTRVFQFLVCALALLLAVPCAVRAQVVTASIRGTISDESGAAVAGAEVTITNVATDYSRTAQTAADGEYSFQGLPLGSYRIHAAHAGFKAVTQTGIELHANDSQVLNVALRIGAVSETVTVEATPVAVETTNGELSGLIQSGQVAELPLNGRNFMQLLTLLPGVAPAEAFSITNKGLKGASDVSVSGGPSNGNQWLVDGANNNDTGSQRTILIYPSVDAIEEFKIERNSYGPQFGLSAGGQVSIVTKSGSNSFHGGAFYSGRNDKLNAYDTELKAGCPTCAKNKFRGNDYGFNVGGPVLKDKVFFFYSEEWNKRIEGLVRSARVPTADERVGNFAVLAACPASAASKAGGHNNIGFPIDPVTGAPALHDPAGPVGNQSFGSAVPAGRQISTSLSSTFMSIFPLPTLSDPCASTNWTKSLGVPTPWREENVRGDVNLTKTLRLMMRYTQDSWQLGPPSAGFGWGSNSLGVIDESWVQPGKIAVGRLSKTFGSDKVNDFQFSWSQNKITIVPTNVPLEQQLNTAIPTFFPLGGKRYGDKGPTVWFQGATNMPGVWTIAPWANEQDLYTFQDDFSWVKNRHTIRAGASLSRNMKDEQQSNSEFGTLGGPVGFNGCKGQIVAGVCPNDTGNTTGYSVADYLLQGMAVGLGESDTIFLGKYRWHNTEFYLGDTFRVNSRLTLVYGFRWSLLPNPYLADNRYTVFNPAAFSTDPAVISSPCNGLLYSPGFGSNPCTGKALGGKAGPNDALWNNNNHLIAPRLSFAWDPTGHGKWSIRGGGGQFFNRDRLFALQISGQNAPFISNFSSTNGRFLDSSTIQPAACAPGCFSTGFGHPTIGNETSNQMPNSWQFNLSVQKELWRDAVLEVGYVGNRNLHWEIRSDVNAVLPANRLAYFQNGGDSGARAALRPFGSLTQDNGITYYTRSGQSNYNSLQTAFNMRFTRNSLFQAAYTWSKLISDTQLIDSPTNNVDFYNPRTNRGPDLLNRPHIFTANVIYNLPTLQNMNSIVRNVAGSWEMSSIVNLASGPSQTPVISGDFAGLGSSGAQRPMRVAGEPCRLEGSDGRQWFNPNAFTVNGLKIGQIGTSGVGTCTGPGNSDVDFSLRKNFKLTERVKMQFQMDFFNLFNHPQYQASAINMNWGFNSPKAAVDVASSALYADSAGNPIYSRTNPTPGSTPFTGCGANHLASATGTSPGTSCASTVINRSYNPGSNFGLAGQSRENGWRQIQYGLKFTF